jgi:serine protease Do
MTQKLKATGCQPLNQMLLKSAKEALQHIAIKDCTMRKALSPLPCGSRKTGIRAAARLFFCLCLFVFLTAPLMDAAPAFSKAIPESFSDLAEAFSPTVVNIRTVKSSKEGGRVFRHFFKEPFDKQDPMKDFFDRFFEQDPNREFKQRSLGSGFIIDKDGFIVTNNHVVENADQITVQLNSGKEFDAKVIGRDPNTDIALIKIKPVADLPFAELGDSEELKVGQWVVAIGNPFGLEHTVTAGIVSAKGRVIGSGPYDDFIQTDASINPGNSGGPLINMNGKVVGINTAIVADGQGIGFAIPINMAKSIIDQLKQYGEVTRGWLGVGIQPLSNELGDYYGIKEGKGVLITEVFPGDPADRSGIKPKDVIVAVNGKSIATPRDLTGIVAELDINEIAQVKVVRGGETKTFDVKIAKRPDNELMTENESKEIKDELGIRITDLTPEISRQFNITDDKGVVVVDVEPGGKGEKAGILMGDLIKEINHEEVSSATDYHAMIKKINTGSPMNFFIRRINSGFIVIQISK